MDAGPAGSNPSSFANGTKSSVQRLVLQLGRQVTVLPLKAPGVPEDGHIPMEHHMAAGEHQMLTRCPCRAQLCEQSSSH